MKNQNFRGECQNLNLINNFKQLKINQLQDKKYKSKLMKNKK